MFDFELSLKLGLILIEFGNNYDWIYSWMCIPLIKCQMCYIFIKKQHIFYILFN